MILGVGGRVGGATPIKLLAAERRFAGVHSDQKVDQKQKREDSIWALRDINLEVREGEILGIIGRNGAGKSTLLKILSRVTAPTSGVVRVRGRLGSLLDVGTGFHPELTGHENVYLNGAILGMTKAEIAHRFDEIVEFSGVGQFIDTPVKRYSKGMVVRLGFAVAAHLDSELLVVDEVLAVGDFAFESKCLGRMKEMTRQGRTIIFVSHNMGAIERLCTSAKLLESGRIVAEGDAREVVSTYFRSTWNLAAGPGEKRSFSGPMGFVSWSTGSDPDLNNYSVFSRDSCDFSFKLAVRQPIRRAHFGFAIRASDETLIWSIRTRDRSDGYVDLVEGTYILRFSLPHLPLRQGEYQLRVSALDQVETHDTLVRNTQLGNSTKQ